MRVWRRRLQDICFKRQERVASETNTYLEFPASANFHVFTREHVLKACPPPHHHVLRKLFSRAHSCHWARLTVRAKYRPVVGYDCAVARNTRPSLRASRHVVTLCTTLQNGSRDSLVLPSTGSRRRYRSQIKTAASQYLRKFRHGTPYQ